MFHQSDSVIYMINGYEPIQPCPQDGKQTFSEFFISKLLCGTKLLSVSQTQGTSCECFQSSAASSLIHYIQLCIDSASQSGDWDWRLCLLLGFHKSEHSTQQV